MKNLIKIAILFAIVPLFTLNAQFIEDALRYSQYNGIYTVRAGALGTSFHGISDDIGALAYNPAGLCLVNKSEFSIGLGFGHMSTDATLMKSDGSLLPNTVLGSTENFSTNSSYFNNIGLVTPMHSGKVNSSFGIGYFMENNFDNTISFQGKNAGSSIINWTANNGNQNFVDNWAYHLWLAGDDLKTPIANGIHLNDTLIQKAFIQESGGLHTLTAGYAIELSKFVSVGATIAGKWGKYKFSNTFEEIDVNNKYTSKDSVYFPNDTALPEIVDFNSLKYETNLEQSVGGISGSIGVLAKLNQFLRLGATIKFPTYYGVDEVFNEKATATFDSKRSYFNNSNSPNAWTPPEYSNSYGVVTPFVYSLGLSFHGFGLTITSGLEYSDATQISFVNIDEKLKYLNQDIVKYLVGQVSWGIGAEYDIPYIPFVVRASYSATSSPYQNDIEGANISKTAFGLGYYAAPNVRIEALMQQASFSQLRQNYGSGESEYIYKTSPLNLALQLTYRY